VERINPFWAPVYGLPQKCVINVHLKKKGGSQCKPFSLPLLLVQDPGTLGLLSTYSYVTYTGAGRKYLFVLGVRNSSSWQIKCGSLGVKSWTKLVFCRTREVAMPKNYQNRSPHHWGGLFLHFKSLMHLCFVSHGKWKCQRITKIGIPLLGRPLFAFWIFNAALYFVERESRYQLPDTVWLKTEANLSCDFFAGLSHVLEGTSHTRGIQDEILVSTKRPGGNLPGQIRKVPWRTVWLLPVNHFAEQPGTVWRSCHVFGERLR